MRGLWHFLLFNRDFADFLADYKFKKLHLTDSQLTEFFHASHLTRFLLHLTECGESVQKSFPHTFRKKLYFYLFIYFIYIFQIYLYSLIVI